MPSPEQLKAWAESLLKGTITDSDKQALEDWYAALPERHDGEVFWNEPGVDSAVVLQSLLFEAIEGRIAEEQRPRRIPWLRIGVGAAAAAAVLGFVLLGGLRMHRQPVPEVVVSAPQDIQPGKMQATLFLADGKQLAVSPQQTLNVTNRNGAVCVTDKTGRLNYLGTAPAVDLYNTLVTQKGQQSPPLVLPDGTKVWLNAASTLRFPVIFSGDTRSVTLIGEAYFEVARNVKQPFVVGMGTSKVEVLGTHFDVKAYDDEPFTYATLLEGAIRVVNGKRSALLSPGQQARLQLNGGLSLGSVVSEESIAWMNGQLPLNSVDVKGFLREVARWYDVTIRYEQEPPVNHFSGSINKDVPISQVLAALNANGIRCRLKEKTIIVGN